MPASNVTELFKARAMVFEGMDQPSPASPVKPVTCGDQPSPLSPVKPVTCGMLASALGWEKPLSVSFVRRLVRRTLTRAIHTHLVCFAVIDVERGFGLFTRSAG